MLPTKKTPPRSGLNDLTILVYGKSKFGKSELCSHADGALFLATEAGLNSLEVYQQPIGTWDELLATAKEIADGKHSFRTIIIDTIDNAYRMCAEYICRKCKIEHESDLEYGKGYSLINNEFYRVLNRLALLPYGLFLVSHSQEKEVETRTGKVTRIVPTLPDKASKIVLGMVDIILFCDFEPMTTADGKPTYRRVLRTKPSALCEAGDRTGRLPDVIDFDFGAFTRAFAQGRAAAATPAAPASPAAGGSPAAVSPPVAVELPAPAAPAVGAAPAPGGGAPDAGTSSAPATTPTSAPSVPLASSKPPAATPPARTTPPPNKPQPSKAAR